MHLPSLTDEELIALVRTRLDLVTSDLERELASRLAAAADEIERLNTEINDNQLETTR